MSKVPSVMSRREALRCLAFGGAGTLFAISGGVLAPIDVAFAASEPARATALGKPLFVQISDTHIGFHKDANPDVNATLTKSIALVNAMAVQPALILHTGDVTHLSKPEEFDTAQAMFSQFRAKEMHVVPGEHDTADPSSDRILQPVRQGIRQQGLLQLRSRRRSLRGARQRAAGEGRRRRPSRVTNRFAWAIADLKARSSSTPIVVFAHMPLWSVYVPWGWRTSDAGGLVDQLRRFGSVTVLNGHIHQIVQKVEGNIAFHTARSTAYPQPAPGEGPGPGPLKLPAEQLAAALGVTSVTVRAHPRSLVLNDTALG